MQWLSRIKGFTPLWVLYGPDGDPVIRKFECGHLYMDSINEVTFVLGMRHKDTHNLPWPASFHYIHTHPHSHISTLIRENASLFISILSVMRSRPMCHWAWARTRAAAQLVYLLHCPTALPLQRPWPIHALVEAVSQQTDSPSVPASVTQFGQPPQYASIHVDKYRFKCNLCM